EYIFGQEINDLYEKILASKGQSQAICLIDNFLCLKARERKKQNKPCVRLSLSVLQKGAGSTNVRMLQKMTNTSPKTLERSFKTEIGMTPKMYQRLLRFNQARQYMEENGYIEDWWEMVLRFGFYDRSHFISEFRFFTGQAPKQYICNRMMM